jgi:hypothetical protein
LEEYEKEREILYEEKKSNTHEWVKVGKLVALFFKKNYLPFALIPF